MKFYPILFLFLLTQIFITLPFQKNFINVENQYSEDIVYSVLRSGGLGPAIIFKAPFISVTQVDITLIIQPARGEQVYFAIYLGNTAFNVALAICIIEIRRFEKQPL
jgi:hypothetical protein